MKPYYEEPGIQIYCGDCREILPTLDRVDVVITDPPYSEWVHAKVRRGGSVRAVDIVTGGPKKPVISTSTVLGFDALPEETRRDCAEQFARLARRWVLTFSDIESACLWREDLAAAGLEYVRTGAWIKLGATPQFTGDRPGTAFETITIAHPFAPPRKHWNGGGRLAKWEFAVLNNSKTEERIHTTQKPIALMLALVSDFSDEGETILDAFMGSGSTLAAAKRLGRKGIGIESDEGNCEKAAERLHQQSRQQSIGFAPQQEEMFA
jgi:hypothetical protein